MSQRTQTIQGTAKEWKAMQLIGFLLIPGGPVLTIYMAFNDVFPDPITGVKFFFGLPVLGIATWVFGMLGAWWNHG